MMYDGHVYGFGGVFMWLFWLLIIGAVVWLIVTNSRGRGEKSASALELLEARYARGEIERDEFEQKKKDISG